MNRTWMSVLLTLCLSTACADDGADRKVRDAGIDAALAIEDAGDQSDGETAEGDGAVLGDGSQQQPQTDAAFPFTVSDAGQVLCGTAPCACSDGVDNDLPADGLVDMNDPECVSPWDNDEGSFATGISGDNRDPKCQDCFFDGNSGAGDDGCQRATSCLSTGLPTSGSGQCATCEVNDQCRSFCQAYTPNGCDCFGCCTVQTSAGPVSVLLGSGCQIDDGVASGCTTCEPSTSCGNTCGRCELCPGKTSLPEDCVTTPADGGVPTPTPSCDEGQAQCGAGLPACPADAACTFGCCVLVPVI